MKNLASDELKRIQIERIEHALNHSIFCFEGVNGNRRRYSRIIDRLPIELELQQSDRMLKGEVIDLSEYGSRFTLKEPLTYEPSRVLIKRFNHVIEGTLDKIIWGGNGTYGTLLSYADDSRASLQNIIQQRVQVTRLFMETVEDYIEYLIKIEGLPDKQNEDVLLKLGRFSNRILLVGDILERLISDKDTRNELRMVFRECIAPWIYQSNMAKHGLEKPRGYPGDYKILETFYNCEPLSDSTMGHYFDRYFIDIKIVVAVRNRKDLMQRLLRDLIADDFITRSQLNILNIACGSCREIKELFSDFTSPKELTFACIDQDEEALEFSKEALSFLPSNIMVNFLKENILNIIRRKRYRQILRDQDIIYSMGLIDYLPDSMLKRLTRFCWEILTPNGKLIFAHKNRHRSESFLHPNWFTDWGFYHRDETELLNLIKGEINRYSLDVRWEETNHIFFVIITKLP